MSRWFRATSLIVAALLIAACGSAGPPVEVAVVPATETVVTPPPTIDAPAATEPPATAQPQPTPTVEPTATAEPTTTPTPVAVVPGLGQLVAADFAPLVGKRVGVIANAATTFDGRHIIDVLAAAPDVDLVAAFAPEHGIRGTADAGAQVADEIDPLTGIPVFSLYGTDRAPTPSSLADIDVLVYDLQDVGARYYTYISTLGLAMQAAAAADIPFVVLDRPNPLGGELIAGFTRQAGYESFVSQYPIPSVYGLTAGELATAIVGEQWLPGLDALDLTVVPLSGWNRSMRWSDVGAPWLPPSPGLPNESSALAYPATVLFEATTLSYGKGTDAPFEMIGAPWLDGAALASDLNGRDLPGVAFDPITFTPVAGQTASPRYVDQQLGGITIRVTDTTQFDPVAIGVHLLSAVSEQAAQTGTTPIIDRPDFFDLLAGSSELRNGLDARVPADQIVAWWEVDRATFQAIHDRYRRY